MAATYDNGAVNSATLFGGTTLSTSTFTIGGVNRIAIVGVMSNENTAPSSVVAGGITASAITGTSQFGATRQQMFVAINPASGAGKSATVNWGSVVTADISVETFQDADQTTGVNNGNATANAFGTTRAITITSTSGDITTTMLGVGGGSGLSGTPSNRTNRLLLPAFGNTDTGPGTGTTTHTWTAPANDNLEVVGCNVIAFVSSSSRRPTNNPALRTEFHPSFRE